MLSGYLTIFVLEQRFGGGKFSYLPCLASGQNSKLASDDMNGLQCQGIAVDDYNYPSPDNITDEVLPPEYGYSCK